MESSIAINVLNEGRTIIGTLDVLDADVNVVYQFSDIRDPEKRKANYVRKFKLPGTKKNNRLFNSFHELGYQITNVAALLPDTYTVESGSGQSFNPNRKLLGQVIVNDNIFFEGALQVNKVNNVNGQIDYEVTIYGNLADFFINIANTTVEKLDFSEYNHALTAKNILQSQWVPSGQKDVMYRTPKGYSSNMTIKNRIIKFGQEYENYIGEGYVYPLIYQGGSDLKTIVHIEKWQPAFYAKTIFDKIFEKAGFRYRSEFLNSETFRRLIIPMSKENLQIDQAAVDKAEFLANVGHTGTATDGFPIGTGTAPLYGYVGWNSGTITKESAAEVWDGIPTSGPIRFNFDTPGSTTAIPAPRDPGDVFKNNDTFVAPKNGTFRLQASIIPVIAFKPPKINFYTINVRNELVDYPGIPVRVKLINKNTKAVLASKTTDVLVPDTSVTTPVAFEGNVFLEWEGYLSKGTELQIIVQYWIRKQVGGNAVITKDSIGTPYVVPMNIYIKGNLDNSSNFSARLTDLNVGEGDAINMNQVAPSISATEFITNINRMFNLYWVPTGRDREFSIEPKDDIYNSAKDKIYDWTESINRDENMSIEPLFNLIGNKYKWSYTEDGDYLNKKYTDAAKAIYGEREIVIDNDFLDDNPEIKTGFSPTPLYSPPFNPGISLSGIFAQDGTKFKRVVPRPRILYWGGMKPYAAEFNDSREVWIDAFGADNKSTGAWIYRRVDSNGKIAYEFPYAGHLDDPYNPTLDLNYGLCEEYYFNYQILTDSNLYNRYWRSSAEEILSPSQHLLTATVNLSSTEVSTLDLRATIQVDNIYYRINKLTYNPITEIGEVELFKTFEYTTFSPSTLEKSAAPQMPESNPGQGAGTNTTIVINTKKDSDVWKDDWTWKGGWNQWEETKTIWVNGNEDLRPWRGSENKPQWTSFLNTGRGSTTWNTVPNKNYTPISQFDNFYPAAGDVFINGKYNNVSPTAQFVTINGNNNSILDGARNIQVSGNFNTILSGVSNVSVVGNNMTISKSNAAYIDGAEISRGGINSNAMTTVVRSPQTIWQSAGVMRGGKNSNGTFVGRKAPVINANAPAPIPKNAIGQSTPPPQWENWMINNA